MTPVAVESISLRPVDDSRVRVTSAGLIAHTWGVELKLVGTGFTAGEVFHAAFAASTGDLVPAGEFLGAGATSIKCNLQSGVLRSDAVRVVVMDASGKAVLATRLS